VAGLKKVCHKIKFVEDRSRVSKTRVRAPTSPPEAHTVLPDGSHRNSCLANAMMTVCVFLMGMNMVSIGTQGLLENRHR
jgi:hypothetical protein